MDEPWYQALEQIEDEHIQEAANYRRKRSFRLMGAAAAVLAVVVSWWAVRQGLVQPPQQPVASTPVFQTEAVDGNPAGDVPVYGMDGLTSGAITGGGASDKPTPPDDPAEDGEAMPPGAADKGDAVISPEASPAPWLDRGSAEPVSGEEGWLIRITEIHSGYFYGHPIQEPGVTLKLEGCLSGSWSAGDPALVFFRDGYYDESTDRMEGQLIRIERTNSDTEH